MIIIIIIIIVKTKAVYSSKRRKWGKCLNFALVESLLACSLVNLFSSVENENPHFFQHNLVKSTSAFSFLLKFIFVSSLVESPCIFQTLSNLFWFLGT